MTVLWFILWLIAVALLLVACYRLEHAQTRIRVIEDALIEEIVRHDVCHQRTERVLHAYHGVSEARILEEAAADYDRPEEQANLMRLGHEQYKPGGPSMPVIWLRDRAEKKRQRSVHDEEVFTLNGEQA